MSDYLEPTISAGLATEQPRADDDLDFEMEMAVAEQAAAEAAQQRQQSSQGRGFFGHVKDIGQALVTAPVEAGRRTLAAVSDVDNALSSVVGKGMEAIGLIPEGATEAELQRRRTQPGLEAVVRSDVLQPETTAGQVVQELGTFATGAVALQKATGAFSWAANATSRLGRIGRSAAVGAPLDAVLTDTTDDNLSHMLREAGVPLPSLLATDADDGALTRRVKSVAEGAGLGVVADTVIVPLARSAAGIFRALRPADQRIAAEAAAAPAPSAAREPFGPTEASFERYRRAELPGEESFPEGWQRVAEEERGNINAAIDKLQGQSSYGDMQRALSDAGVREVEAAAREIAVRQNILDNFLHADEIFTRLRKENEVAASHAAHGDATWTREVPGEHPLMREAAQAAEGRGEGWDAARAAPAAEAPTTRDIQGDPGPEEMARMVADAQAELRAARGAYEALMDRGILTAEEKAALDRAIAVSKSPAPSATPSAPKAATEATQGAEAATPAPKPGEAATPPRNASPEASGAPAQAPAQAPASATPAPRAQAMRMEGMTPPSGTAAQRVLQVNLPDDLARAIELDEVGAQNVQRLLSEGKPEEAMDALTINPMHVQGREGIAQVLNALHDTYAPAFREANQRVTPEAATVALADAIGSTPEAARAALAKTYGNTRDLDAMALLSKRYMTSSAQRVLDLSRAVAGGDAAASADLVAAVARAKEAREFFEGTASSLGRALRSLQIDADAMAHLNAEDFAGMLAEAGGPAAVEKFARRVSMLQSPEQLARVLKGTLPERFMAATEELFINNILSGPVTQTINLTSSAVNALLNPIRHIIGGAFTGDWTAVRGGAAMYHAYGESFMDHIRLLKLAMDGPAGRSELSDLYQGSGPKAELLNGVKAFWDDAPVLDRVGTGLAVNEGRGHAITASNFNVTNAAGAAVIDVFGKAIRLPTRVMMGADEIVRGLAYRMELRRMATEEALEGAKTGTLNGDRAVAEFIERAITSPTEDAHKLALQVARETTFSQKLDRNGRVLDRIGSRVTDMVAAYPPLRAFLPFITTPTNIIKWFADHSVVAPLASGAFYRDLRGLNGPMAQRMAAGKMGMGATLWGAAYYLTSTGAVTGSIPGGAQGTSERATGALPYSIRVVGVDGEASFVPFGRFDPVVMHLGVAADLAQLWDHREARTVEAATMGYIVAVAQNLFSKSYLKGVADLFSMVTDPISSSTNPGERLGRQIANTSAALVPFSGLQRAVARSLDTTQRETRPDADGEWSFLRRTVNQITAQTPGLSDSLPPIRDLMGKPVQVPIGWGRETFGGLMGSISPLQYRDESKEPFLRELRRLGYDMQQLVPWRNSDGLPMPAPIRDRLILLTTQGAEFNGQTMQEALNTLVQSDAYREQATDDGRDGSPGSRRNMLGAVVRAYKAMGEELLRQENPEWAAQVQQTRIRRRQQLIPGLISGQQ